MKKQIEQRLKILKQIQENKASTNALLELEQKELENKLNAIKSQINSNLWVNSSEKMEYERLIITLEEIEKIEGVGLLDGSTV